MRHTNVMDIVFLHLSLFYSFNPELLLLLKEECYKRTEFSRQRLVHNSFKRLHVCKRQIKQPPLIYRQHLLHKVIINDNTGISFVVDFHAAAPTHKRHQQRGLHICLSVQNDVGKWHINPKQIFGNLWNQSLHKSLLRTADNPLIAISPSLFGVL